MKIKCLKFEQNGQSMFSFIINGKFIYDKFDVSRRIEDKESGYQRSFSKTRISQISKFIDNHEGILPNSILVNLDTDSYTYHDDSNEIEFHDKKTLGLIIDGQHRIWGISKAKNDINVPVVATDGLDSIEQAKLFIKINKTQRGVPVSLYLDLLDLTDGIIEDFDDEGITAERRAIEISKRLNNDEESPLFELIRTTGENGKGISLSEIVTKLKPYVDPKNGKFLNYGFEDQYKLFKIYFKSIKSVFLDQWNDPNTLILKTVGFGGLMKSFYEIFQLTVQGNKSFSTDTLIDILSKISDFKFDSENFPGGGVKAEEAASKKIISQLKLALKKEGESQINIIED